MRSGCVLGRHITGPDFHFRKMVLELPEGNGLMGSSSEAAPQTPEKDGKASTWAGRRCGLEGRPLPRYLGGKLDRIGV